MKRVTKAAAKAAADEVEKALDQIVREAKDEVEERKEQIKSTEQYGWWKGLTSRQRGLYGFLAAFAVLWGLVLLFDR